MTELPHIHFRHNPARESCVHDTSRPCFQVPSRPSDVPNGPQFSSKELP